MLSIDAERMRNVDTRNVENLFGMWSGEQAQHIADAAGDANLGDQCSQSAQSQWRMAED